MSRLEKFKTQKESVDTITTKEKSGGSFYDMLSREKAKKDQQLDNQKTQQELLRQREELARQNQYMDMGEM
jgi:N-methylhydantoinase B/oxoprolinase/acetone carboxylase alpha subunit